MAIVTINGRQVEVEVEGMRSMTPACITKVTDGMVVHTASSRKHN